MLFVRMGISLGRFGSVPELWQRAMPGLQGWQGKVRALR